MKTLACLLLIFGMTMTVFPLNAGDNNKTKKVVNKEKKHKADSVVGKWISVNINAQSILFALVSSVEIDLKPDNTFTATVTFVDFQTASKKGTYRIDGKHIYGKVNGIPGEEKCIFWFKDGYFYVKDKALCVTGQLKRKTKNSGDGSWL